MEQRVVVESARNGLALRVSGEAARIAVGALLAAEGEALVELTLDCLESHVLRIR